MITVASYIAKFLVSKNVTHVFGFQGSAMLKILDEIVGHGIKYVQNFNEQASAFCADSYARISDNIGVAVATSGPGASNLIGGIANAYFDSVPTLFISGNDHLKNLINDNSARQNGFQDMDIVSMIKPVTKYSVLVDKAEDIRFELEKAYYIATTGRKGSVLVDIPIDIQFKEIDENSLKAFEPLSEEQFDLKADKFIEALREAKRPVILAGGGVRGANAVTEFRKFVSKTGIPVVTTLNGIDVLDNIVGFSGLYGNTEANLSLLNADLIIAMGTRFAQQHIGKNKKLYCKEAKIVHIDIDKSEINRTFITEYISIIYDLRVFLSEINKRWNCQLKIEKWKEKIDFWKNKCSDTVILGQKNVIPVKFIRELSKHFSDNVVVAADVGANQMWTAQGLRLKNNQRLLNSAGFGAMGYALSAAIGSSYISPSVAITGDGGFQMNLQELNTLSLHRNNVKCFIFNNSNLALMRYLQKNYYQNHFFGNNEKEFSCPDIRKLAETFELDYEKIETELDFFKLERIFSNDRPYLIEVIVDKDTPVLNRYDDRELKTENIFFDLDGTLIDSRKRMFELFVSLCPECKMSFDEYWKIKRGRINQKDFLKKYYDYSDEKCKEFHKLWLEKIESELDKDILFKGMREALEKLNQKYNLYTVTSRQSKAKTIKQFETLGILEFFRDILVTEQKESKIDLIQKRIRYNMQDIFVGDTGEDVITAHKLGIKSIAVTWGILDSDILNEYEPDDIVSSIDELISKIE